MFDFFVARKKVILECFTSVSHAYDYAKIDYAIQYIPEWWKNTPKIHGETNRATIKNCAGFIDFYKKGIVIPSWFEFEMTIGEEIKWEASTEITLSDSHDQSQFKFFTKTNGHNIKISSPWAFRTQENINFVWSQPTWNMRDNLSNLTILPGMLNFKHQRATHINCFVEAKETPQLIKIDSMTPLAILHPLTERNIEIKNHLVSFDEFVRIRDGVHNMFFSRTPEEIIRKKKRIEKLQSKCPYGFK
jgi:hypothetical protein